MPDEVQKTFVRSFVGYLKKQVTTQALTPDAQESVEVAVQCLQAAFDIDEDVEEVEISQLDAQPTVAGVVGGETQAVNTPASSAAKLDAKEIDLFELFQSLYIERNPESLQMAETIKNEGNRLMKDGKYNEALLQYNRAITFDPKNPIFYCNRAAAYIRLGDNERAITDCKSALVYNPNYSKAYGRLGIAYSNLGKYNEAQQAYARAIELEPENQDYRNNLEVARNAQEHVRNNAMPSLTEGINMMLTNPSIRNLFSNAEIDLEQLQNMSQNPLVMNAIGQMFSGLQGGGVGGVGGAGGAVPPMPNDMLQLFQTFASQLANTAPPPQGGNQPGSGSGDQPGNQQPPST